MKANKEGIALTAKELRALRRFASKEITDRDRYGVQFEISGEKVYARASNGNACVEFEGISDGKHKDGEWFVQMGFLIDARKQLEGKQVARLLFSGASLHDAAIEENGLVRGIWKSEDGDASITKALFPPFARALKIPSSRRAVLACVPLGAAYTSAAQLVADAVEDELIEWFHPADLSQYTIFRVGAEKETSALGAIKANATPEAVKAKGEGEDEDDESEDGEKKGKGKKRNPKQPELPSAPPAE